MDLLFTTAAAGPRQRSHSRDHILLSQIRHSPNMEGPVPAFISPRNRVTQLYLWALCSLFVASYNSTRSSGGIRTHLHAGITQLNYQSSLDSPGMDHTEKVSSIIAHSLTVRGNNMSTQSCSLATAAVLSPVYTAVTWQWGPHATILNSKTIHIHVHGL
jgi:hypothetical protein